MSKFYMHKFYLFSDYGSGSNENCQIVFPFCRTMDQEGGQFVDVIILSAIG